MKTETPWQVMREEPTVTLIAAIKWHEAQPDWNRNKRYHDLAATALRCVFWQRLKDKYIGNPHIAAMQYHQSLAE